MASVGPTLPPGFSKRKRDSNSDSDEPSDGSTPKSVTDSPSTTMGKKRRVIGPTMPLASLDSRPVDPLSSDSDYDSDSEDGAVGPSLPPPPGQQVGSRASTFYPPYVEI